MVIDVTNKHTAYAVSSFFAVSILALMLLGSMSVRAGDGPKIVQGYAYDDTGNPLGGVVVTVVVIDKDTHLVKDTQTDTTGSPDGYYSVSFDTFIWNIGDTIRATGTYNSVDQPNETLADASAVQDIDINFTTAIPQFGSVLGFAVAAGLVCAVGILFVSYRRRH